MVVFCGERYGRNTEKLEKWQDKKMRQVKK